MSKHRRTPAWQRRRNDLRAAAEMLRTDDPKLAATLHGVRATTLSFRDRQDSTHESFPRRMSARDRKRSLNAIFQNRADHRDAIVAAGEKLLQHDPALALRLLQQAKRRTKAHGQLAGKISRLIHSAASRVAAAKAEAKAKAKQRHEMLPPRSPDVPHPSSMIPDQS